MVKRSRNYERGRIDIAGTVAAMGGIAFVVLALLEGNSWVGWA